MIESLPPFIVYVLGGLFLPLIPAGQFRSTLSLLIPIAGAALILSAPNGLHAQVMFLGFELTFLRMDGLSNIFGLIFSIAAFVGLLYAWHLRDTVQQMMAIFYAGAAIGAVFAGDLLTLFIFWESTAIASVFLIWARRTTGAYYTAMRYLIIQIGSGVILLAGVVLYYTATGSLGFDAMVLVLADPRHLTMLELGVWLIFISFGIKSAFPLLHNWLQDSYPSATITGAVFLSAFTTKLAIYTLARGFPATEILIYIGAVMVIFTVFYAVIENDLRRILAYSLNNQLGFMVIGIGIGTEMALNGVAAHAVVHILYKALLFMSVGAVLYRTGKTTRSDLGGLYRTMPLTMIFCVIGAASALGVPLFAGFASKSLIVSAATHEGYYITWGILVFGVASVFYHAGGKVPYFTFFAKDSGLRPKEAPFHMLLAMALAATLTIVIGIFPQYLYDLLPYEVAYNPYTVTHVITQLQLLFFAALAFALMIRYQFYPPALKTANLDFDWIYRRLLPAIIGYSSAIIALIWQSITTMLGLIFAQIVSAIYRSHGPDGTRANPWPSAVMVLSICALLAFVSIVVFLG